MTPRERTLLAAGAALYALAIGIDALATGDLAAILPHTLLLAGAVLAVWAMFRRQRGGQGAHE